MAQKRSVFVYGTLKRGQSNHQLIKHYIASVTPAAVRGWLYNLGPYPAVVEGSGWVYGELVEFLPEFVEEAFQSMDQLEGVNHARPTSDLYERITTKAVTMDGESVSCEMYRYPNTRKEELSLDELLPSGLWPQGSGQDRVPYVAYGSCMSEASFAKTVAGYQMVGRVEIPGYRVAFTRYSIGRSGGVADLIPAIREVAEGILYLIPQDQMETLDRREGAPLCYRRIPVPIVCDGLFFPAITYEVTSKLAQEVPPHRDYADIIMEGAKALSLKYAETLQKRIEELQNAAAVTASLKGGM